MRSRPSPRRSTLVWALAALAAGAAVAPVAAQPSSEPIDVVLGDLNHDALADVLSANRYSEDIVLRRNPGTGVLLAPVSVSLAPASLGPIAAAGGDLDGDGLADDCAVGCNVTDTIALVFDVAGAASIQTVHAGGMRPRDVVVVELDGAAPAEVVLGREGDGSGVGAGLGLIRGGGAVQEIAIPAGNPARVIRLVPADFDGDGPVDLAVAVVGSGEAHDRVLLYRNDGAGELQFAGPLGLPGVGKAVALAARDLDGDGWIDLAALVRDHAATGNLIRVFRSTGSGPLAPGLFAVVDVPSPHRAGLDLALGDLDGDGLGDAVVANGEGRGVVAHLGFSGHGFASVRTLTMAIAPVSIALGDLNGDWLDDVVVADAQAEQVLVLRSPGPLSPAVAALGPGCAGTGGLVPQIAAPVPASAGEPAFAIELSQALPLTAALLLAAGADAAIALPGGCALWVEPPLIQLATPTSAAGQAGFAFGIPNTPAVMGARLALQWAVVDPQGAFAGALAFSDGLLVRMGS
jgi:hypothetical protein